jgi:hypothetical protein
MLRLALCSASLAVVCAAAPALAQKKPEPKAAPAAAAMPTTVAEILVQAQKLYDSLEYDKVAPLAVAALAAPDISSEQKLIAYQLQGSSLAIVGDATAAERPFLLLLSVRPEFALPDDTGPKIKAVFAKVKAEFDQVELIKKERLRRELQATVALTSGVPGTAVGGRPLRLEVGVSDPRGVVTSVRVQYKKRGEGEFLSLPLVRDPKAGVFVGAVPGEWTASDAGFAMDVVVTAADSVGPLQQLGVPTPLSVDVAPGSVDRTVRPVPVWVFGTAASATAVAVVASGAVAGATAYVNYDYHRQLDESTPEKPALGSAVVAQANLGNTLNVVQAVGWGTAGIGAVLTGVLALFTNWSGEDGEAAAAPSPTPPTAPAR